MVVFSKLLDTSKSKAINLLHNCCICKRNGKLALIFRTTIDPNSYPHNSHIIGVSVDAKLLITHQSDEGEWIFLNERQLKLEQDGLLGGPIPVDLVHTIDENSPLYDLSKPQVETMGLPIEIVVRINGSFESTGVSFQ